MRKLRVLLIDDNPVSQLETEYLDLVRLPYFGEDESRDQVEVEGVLRRSALRTWAQHLWLWLEGLFPREGVDLVLIDCRFEEDVYAPNDRDLRRADPRGLLHGAIFLSRIFGGDRYHPFGFSVYSQDARVFANDPYAQTFMGYLLAMTEATLPPERAGHLKGRDERELPAICSDYLLRMAASVPADAWQPALAMYRRRLEEAFQWGGYILDVEAWRSVAEALRMRDRERLLAGVGLVWRGPGGQESVDIRSIFADRLEGDILAEYGCKDAQEWVESLHVNDYLGFALDWAIQANAFSSVVHGDLPDVPKMRDITGASLRPFLHACSATIAWLDNRLQPDQKQLKSGDLLRQLDLTEPQVERYFKPRVKMPWGKIVQALDEGLEARSWPFPDLWELRSVVQDWATNFSAFRRFPF